MSNNQPLLQLNHVSKSYTHPALPEAYHVLQGISLAVHPGETIAVLGPSGSGKSTLLNLMGLLDRPSSGQVLFQGSDTAGFSNSQAALHRNRDLGFVFQLHHLLPQCSVLENVLLPTLPDTAADSDLLQSRAQDLLASAGLHARLHHLPGELSG
ncbi:ATP-binding cassette domain-containing protein, partial [candidate division FCPU426 bacterium]|nr:ATP-binding cassette domain-containing protein [candidate division FCPU426 bacterium]